MLLQLGSLMYDEATDTPVPIVAVTICPRTGNVLPVGGVRGSDSSPSQPIIPYDTCDEPMSGKSMRIHGVYTTAEGQVCPTS